MATFDCDLCSSIDLHADKNAFPGQRVSSSLAMQETVVRRESTPQAVELARRLKDAGAKMYGAFWCSPLPGAEGGLRCASPEGSALCGVLP